MCLKHIQLAYSRGWPGALPQLFKEKVDGIEKKVDGKAKVTVNKSLIDSLTKYKEETSK